MSQSASGEPLLHCYLRDELTPPEPGDRALCGHVRTKEWDEVETGKRCVVCEELLSAIEEDVAR